MPNLNAVAQIAAGREHNCAALRDGTLRCWGYNFRGQLGDGTTATNATPVTVTGIINAVAVTGGGDHRCALISGGESKCWGNNSIEQLGDGGSGGISRTAVTVTNLGSNGVTARAIAAGYQHTCALLTNDTVQCWGANAYGAIGDGTFISTASPKTVVALQAAATGINSAARIAAGK